MNILAYIAHLLYGKDIFFDIVGVVVLTIIGIFTLKFYKINPSNKKHLYFSVAFFLIAGGFLFNILTNFTIYYTAMEVRDLGLFKISYHVLKESDILFDIGFFFYRVLMLLGLYVLFSLYNKKSDTSTNILIVFLILVLSYFTSSAGYIFHLAVLLLLGVITWRYYQNYKKCKECTAKYLVISFAIITISHFLFVLYVMHPAFEEYGEIMQLIGYLGLAITFISVKKYGKKKVKN